MDDGPVSSHTIDSKLLTAHLPVIVGDGPLFTSSLSST